MFFGGQNESSSFSSGLLIYLSRKKILYYCPHCLSPSKALRDRVCEISCTV